ncbi:hypothetical protein ACFXPN_29585 [Streptomyces griseorubiginosus]|uniref:hypothetical protein n=1 Tax=Streptomyces griseorubiginosus TaxID=67304 RepID=UPI0036789EB6
MRRSVELQIITDALATGPGGNRRSSQRIWGRAFGAPMDTGAAGNVWVSDPHELAVHIHTRLYGRPDTTVADSPLAESHKARHQGDIEGEITALMDAGIQLASAPWYPARPGDLVHVHYEQAGDMPPFGETYIVADADGPGDPAPRLLSMQLLAHTCPDAIGAGLGMVGCFATDESEDPLYEPWYEAGPHRLTIVRDGRPVHVGGPR